jgi:hypothetical protein
MHDGTGNATSGENDSNALFIPPIACKEDCEKWPDPCLDIGKKKIQPVQTAQGLL